jgi:hypothetical protein
MEEKNIEKEYEVARPPKDEETQKLFSAFCNAEAALKHNLDKKPRAGKTCDCEDEAASVSLFIETEERENRCMDCGGKV